MTPVITAYSEELLYTTSSLAWPPLATDKNGEVEGSVVGKGVGFIDPLSLSARRPAGEVRGQRAGAEQGATQGEGMEGDEESLPG